MTNEPSFVVDRLRVVQLPAGIWRQQILQIRHEALRPNERMTSAGILRSGRPDNVAELLQFGETAAFEYPGVMRLCSVCYADNLPTIIDGSRNGVVVRRERLSHRHRAVLPDARGNTNLANARHGREHGQIRRQSARTSCARCAAV
jgi:hypothetical protein